PALSRRNHSPVHLTATAEILNSTKQSSSAAIMQWECFAPALRRVPFQNHLLALFESVASVVPKQLLQQDTTHPATRDRIQSNEWEGSHLPTQQPVPQILQAVR